MGRYYWSKKDTVEDCTKLSIAKLKEFGLLTGFSSTALTWTYKLSGHKSSVGILVDVMDEPYVKLNYTITDRNSGEKTDYDYKIRLATTQCHFGGVRYWFICPLSRNGVSCGRQVGTLFLSSGGKYFGCRHCYDLSYESRNECRLGRFGQLGYLLKAERQYEDLQNTVKRWTYKGRPTRKARKLQVLEQRMATCERIPLDDLLRRGKKG
ncbi:MAG: hypothetical protein NTW55_06380 [Planctomycetota bacterium]|nr:hypothetical protein [Planctomycetota bacterium]